MTQRILCVTTVALVPAVAVMFYYLTAFHQVRQDEVHDAARNLGQLASLEMARIVSGAEGILRSVALAPAVRAFDTAACSAYLSELSVDLGQFAAITVVDADGEARCRTRSTGAAMRLSDRPDVREAIRTRTFVVGEFAPAVDGGAATLPLVLPMFGPRGGVAGAVVGELDLTWLGERVRDREFPRDSALTVADRNGMILAREPFPDRFVGTRIPDRYWHLVTGAVPGTVEVKSQDGTDRIIGYFPPAASTVHLYVSAGISRDVALAPIVAATYRAAAIALLGAFAALVLASVVGHSLFRVPLQKLLRTIRSWEKGNESARTGIVAHGGELEAVGAAVDRFMDALEVDRAARRLAEKHRDLLVAELNHRVKNLLATVQALAVQTFGGRADREMLDAFGDRLATMARMHEMLMADNWVKADLQETVRSSIGPFDGAVPSRFSIGGPGLMIQASVASALSMALHELCTNAVKYGALRPGDGRILVEWHVEERSEGRRFRFVWAETGGPPVAPPTSAGFGTKMIEKALAFELDARVHLEFPVTGVVCTVEADVDTVLAEAPGTASDSEAAARAPHPHREG